MVTPQVVQETPPAVYAPLNDDAPLMAPEPLIQADLDNRPIMAPQTDAPTPEVVEEFEVPADALPKPSSSEADRQAISTQERQELEFLRRRAAELDQIDRTANLRSEAQSLVQQYQARGYDEVTAREFATVILTERQRAQSQVFELQQAERLQRAKVAAATHYGKQYGVTPRALVDFDSPEAMERHAALIQHTAKQEKRLKALEKKSVPQSQYDNGTAAGSAPLDGVALENAIGSGQLTMTPDRMQKLQAYYKSQGLGG